MTREQKQSASFEFLRTIGTIVISTIVASVIMGFIMKPENNKAVITTLEKKAAVGEEVHRKLEETSVDHAVRIKALEAFLPSVATKEDLKELKNDLIRELKR